MVPTVLIVAGGDRPSPGAVEAVGPVDRCIVADSGLDHAYALGLHPDLLVGDLDSVSPGGLARAEAEGMPIERHPGRKAETDLELALAAAVADEPVRVVVLGAGGGRLDHAVANLLLLGDDRFAGVDLDAVAGGAWVTVVRSRPRRLRGSVGDLVSLLPIHGDARGVTTTGLEYPLVDATLVAGAGRGVSNVIVAPDPTVVVDAGVLMAIQPDAIGASGPGGTGTGGHEGDAVAG
ncbi:MAG: thiamine diphosphokinase [Acidimicrobiales bacterium]